MPRSSLSPPPPSASFSPSFSFTSSPGFTSRSSSFATSLGSEASAASFASSGSSAPGYSSFGAGFSSPGYSLRTEPSPVYTGGFTSPGSRSKSLTSRTPSTGLGFGPSNVAAIAENAGRFFARTFRAFSGNPAETVKFDLFTR